MSAIPYTQTAPAAVKKPGVLTAGFFSALLSVLAGVAGALVIFIGGKEMVAELAKDYFGAELGISENALGSAMYAEVFAEAYDKLAFRAGLVVFFCVLALIATLLLRNGGLGGRVFFTVVFPLTVFAWWVVLRDMAPMGTKIAGYAGITAGLIAVVLIWLPAVNKYNEARKALKR
ncbi:hypothetical protein Lesp02_43520 [Lentzea sp. NBRC 105346]|uniref:hypothetical protein n=1 Tax=Lentzea sp. NBRC 105346 TaxID=3032205 RepID=UPI0024A115E4|nr:hypothetical protein [Lentzea sp. NBRC 105346]GLZ32164.1 hypothetical protein Lesp02_43520 [Lentzea sp. NBRC 105346]